MVQNIKHQTGTGEGADILDDVHNTLTKYVRFPSPQASVSVALWIAATHGIPAWQHATRLAISSPQKRCGKSRLLDIVAALSWQPLLCASATTAAIYRSLGDSSTPPTLIMDEVDAIFGTKTKAEQNDDLRALLNAGFGRNRPALRCVGPKQEPTPFPTFAMAALAGIGRLPDTVTDRAVNIALQRRARGETVASFRARRDSGDLEKLNTRINEWINANIGALTDAEPTMPVEDREADTWEPLIAVADLAGGRWPKLAREACRKLTRLEAEADADDGLETLLLNDIRSVFTNAGDPEFMSSQMLTLELRKIEESPWGPGDLELTQRKLAHRLKPFNLRPGHDALKTIRGYRPGDFADIFHRYLPVEQKDPSIRPEATDEQQ